MSDHDIDLDELRFRHEETRDAALSLAARLADLVADGPFDTATLALRAVMAHDLRKLLTQEQRLRRAIKVCVAG